MERRQALRYSPSPGSGGDKLNDVFGVVITIGGSVVAAVVALVLASRTNLGGRKHGAAPIHIRR